MAKSQGTGTIFQLEKDKPRSKCRKWRLSVSLGFNPYTGKYPQKVKRFNGTYSEAVKALEDFRAEVQSGQVVESNDWTYDAYMEHFEKVRAASGEIAPGTLERERTKLEALGYLIGKLKMQKITPPVIEQAFVDMRNGKSRRGLELSGTYLNDIYKKASLMFSHAQKNKVVATNPFDSVEAPKIDTEEKAVASADQIAALLSALDPKHHMQCALILCVTMGLRRGEAMALCWEDVDLKKEELHVSHNIDNHLEYQSPKTKAGNRILPLPAIATASLKARYEVELEQFKEFAPDLLVKDEGQNIIGISPKAPVFCEKFGKPIIPNSFGRWWNRNRGDYGLEGFTLHQLRHTFLTIAAEQGVHPSVMQKLAGHSTSRLTMEIYTHVQMGAKREAMDALDEIFEGARPKAS